MSTNQTSVPTFSDWKKQTESEYGVKDEITGEITLPDIIIIPYNDTKPANERDPRRNIRGVQAFAGLITRNKISRTNRSTGLPQNENDLIMDARDSDVLIISDRTMVSYNQDPNLYESILTLCGAVNPYGSKWGTLGYKFSDGTFMEGPRTLFVVSLLGDEEKAREKRYEKEMANMNWIATLPDATTKMLGELLNLRGSIPSIKSEFKKILESEGKHPLYSSLVYYRDMSTEEMQLNAYLYIAKSKGDKSAKRGIYQKDNGGIYLNDELIGSDIDNSVVRILSMDAQKQADTIKLIKQLAGIDTTTEGEAKKPAPKAKTKGGDLEPLV